MKNIWEVVDVRRYLDLLKNWNLCVEIYVFWESPGRTVWVWWVGTWTAAARNLGFERVIFRTFAVPFGIPILNHGEYTFEFILISQRLLDFKVQYDHDFLFEKSSVIL